ncbi:hypothetical protein MUN89_03615 [Halobacillus salinarum]|uniref:Uncharacterized protein n=1 Tax=Halobacillus salinarum TaxID=2932257 RepID=A0ABY4EKR1_9BACI|nr:hypothetical protein [Halobacillus salinarum]UOQ45053.1 hypothetical protein MUN89_03615 [Halobacillus salinarum]
MVEHKAQSFDQIAQGVLKVSHIDPIVDLLSQQRHEDPITIDIFDHDGSHYQNTIAYQDGLFEFHNTYNGYKGAPQGNFSCKYIEKRGPLVYLSSCIS